MVGLKMNKNIGTGLVLVLGLLSQVQAHIALWDEAMYGYVINSPSLIDKADKQLEQRC
jgi:hypothetical protein